MNVNRDILESYTRDDKDKTEITSAIVLVNHQKVCNLNHAGSLRKGNNHDCLNAGHYMM